LKIGQKIVFSKISENQIVAFRLYDFARLRPEHKYRETIRGKKTGAPITQREVGPRSTAAHWREGRRRLTDGKTKKEGSDQCSVMGRSVRGITFPFFTRHFFFANLLVTGQISKTSQPLSPSGGMGHFENLHEITPQNKSGACGSARFLDQWAFPFPLVLSFCFTHVFL